MIVDTDVGFDDLLAILYLLADGRTEIEAFTVVKGIADVDRGANILLRMQELLRLPRRIPVYKGLSDQPKSFPDEWRNQASALNWGDPQSLRAETVPATDFLRERFVQEKLDTRLLAIGPLTNIGAVLRGIRPNTPVSAIVMGGAIHVPGNLPEADPVAEANCYVDPGAANAVFAFFGPDAPSPVNARLVPLDACNQVPIDHAFLLSFFQLIGRKALLFNLAAQILLQIDRQFLAHGVPYFAYDPLAAVSIHRPAVLHIQPGAIVVDEQGHTTLFSGDPGIQRVALSAIAGQFYAEFNQAFGATTAAPPSGCADRPAGYTPQQ